MDVEIKKAINEAFELWFEGNTMAARGLLYQLGFDSKQIESTFKNFEKQKEEVLLNAKRSVHTNAFGFFALCMAIVFTCFLLFGWVDGIAGSNQCIVNVVVFGHCVVKTILKTIIATVGISAAATFLHSLLNYLLRCVNGT